MKRGAHTYFLPAAGKPKAVAYLIAMKIGDSWHARPWRLSTDCSGQYRRLAEPGHRSSQTIARYEHNARTSTELDLGRIVSLAEGIPELSIGPWRERRN